MRSLLSLLVLSTAVFAPAVCASANMDQGPVSKLEKEVRHELVMLPYYSVFDDLTFEVNGSTVILNGKVTKPALKDDAGKVVKNIEGVERVDNRIEVLPLSPNDDRIRAATFRAVYSALQLNRYALQAVPPIHIIVENGNVTLEGVVANSVDRDVANLQAQHVSGVFSVTDHLRVEEGPTGKGK